MPLALALHGGAGTILRTSITPEQEVAYLEGLRTPLLAGWEMLQAGGSALDVTEHVVQLLEDNVLFNAGRGSVFTHDGLHEMDASIMCGKGLAAGSVAAVRNVRNPILLARQVMERSEHVFMAGPGAEEFAREIGTAFEPDDYFYDDYRYNQLLEARANDRVQLDHSHEKKYGTVGAVALDRNGDLAAATSTGGMTNKRYGRIGDSPIIGAGTYANNRTCAVSCTGHGEFFIRSVVAYDLSCLLEYKGLSLQQACRIVVHEKLPALGGEGGLIAVDRDGNVELPFNSEGMYRGSVSSTQEALVRIYR